jgi:hypothetical protein
VEVYRVMARKGCVLTELEIRKIVQLLAQTDLPNRAIASRMGCSKSSVISINRRFRVREYNNHRNTWMMGGLSSPVTR